MSEPHKNTQPTYRPPSQEAIEKLAEIIENDSVKEAAETIVAATGCQREDAYYAVARDAAKKNS